MGRWQFYELPVCHETILPLKSPILFLLNTVSWDTNVPKTAGPRTAEPGSSSGQPSTTHCASYSSE